MKTVSIRGKRYALEHFVGQVLSTSKTREAHVFGTGNESQLNVHSVSVTHDDIFLRDSTGAERVVRLVDFDVACREGNQLLVAWLTREGRSEGRYVLAHNRSTGEIVFDEHGLDVMFRRWVVPASLAAYVLLTIVAPILCVLLLSFLTSNFSTFRNLFPLIALFAALAAPTLFYLRQRWAASSIDAVKRALLQVVSNEDAASGNSQSSSATVSLPEATTPAALYRASLAATGAVFGLTLVYSMLQRPSPQPADPLGPAATLATTSQARALRQPAPAPVKDATSRDARYGEGLPTTEVVVARIAGTNDFETAARRAAAFEILYKASGDLLGPREFDRSRQSPEEKARRIAYRRAWEAENSRGSAGLGKAEAARFHRLQITLSVSDPFRRYVWEQTTERVWREQFVPRWRELATASGPIPSVDTAPSTGQMLTPKPN